MSTGPSLSVVVPTYRRPDRLARCLEALAGLDHPRDDYEVIVVDDGSPEPVAATVDGFADRLRVTCHRQPNTGPATARNTGAAAARGTHLVFTDDDCTPRPGWLSALARALAARPHGMAGGVTVNALADNVWSAASQDLVSYICGYYATDGRSPFLASNNMAMAADGFHALGGFDTTFPRPGGEDRDLCDRWARAGRPIAVVDDAVLDHWHALGPRSFVRQHVNYGRGAHTFHTKRTAASGAPLRPEPPRFYVDLLRHPFRRRRRGQAAAVAALLGAAQLANAAGFAAEAVGARRRGRAPGSSQAA